MYNFRQFKLSPGFGNHKMKTEAGDCYLKNKKGE